MGRRKWCFGRSDVICMTRDCPYMAGCVQEVHARKVAALVAARQKRPRRRLPVVKRVERKRARTRV